MTQVDAFERTRKKRGHDRDEQRALTALVRRQRRFMGALAAAGQKLTTAQPPVREPSQRVGEKDGHPTRTYTNQWRPVPKPEGLVSYIDRLSGKKKSDLEAVGGLSADEFTRLAEDRERSIADAGVKRRTAVLEQLVEFPYEMPLEIQVATVAEITRGHEGRVTWAIHGCGKDGKDGPHVHILWLAGPRGERPVEGGKAMAANRHQVARTINSVFRRMAGRRLEAEFWGGKDRDLDRPGIVGRPPKRRKTRPVYECQRKRDELVAAGMPVPERIRRLAEAGDRHDEMNRLAAQKGLKETPLSGKEGRIADYSRMQAEIDELKKPWSPASKKMADFIRDRAVRAGLVLPDGWNTRLHGGDVMAAVKAGEKGGAGSFAEKIAEAQARAARRAEILEPILAAQREAAVAEEAALDAEMESSTPPQEKSDGHDRHGDGPEVGIGRGRAAAAPERDAGRARPEPPPWARDRLCELSDIDLVRGGRGVALLLPNALHSDLEGNQAPGDHDVRRAGTAGDVIAALREAAGVVDAQTAEKVGVEITESTTWERAAESAAEAIPAGEQAEITAQIEHGAADAGRDIETREAWQRGVAEVVAESERDRQAIYIESEAERAGAEIADRLRWQAGAERATEEAQATALTRGIEQAADAAGRAIADRLAWQRGIDAARVEAERARIAVEIEQVAADAGRTIADRLRWQRGVAAVLDDAERAARSAAFERAAEAAGDEIMVSVSFDLAAALAATEITERRGWERSTTEALAAAQRAEVAEGIEQAANLAAAEIARRSAWERGVELLSEPAGLPAIQAATERLRIKLRRYQDEHRSADGSARREESGGRGGSARRTDDDRRHLGDDQGAGRPEAPRRPESGPGRPGIAGRGRGDADGRAVAHPGAARQDRGDAGRTAVTPQPAPKTAAVQPSRLAPPAAPRFSIRPAGKDALSVRDATIADAKGKPAIVGYINTANAAVFRAYFGGEKDVGPLGHLSGKALDAGKPDSFAQQIATLAAAPVARAPVKPVEPAAARAPSPAPKTPPLPTKESPPPAVADPPPPALVGRAVFWPMPRVADGGDTSKLDARRAEKLVEIKARTDDELLADRAATKAKVATLLADGNPAGARGYEQGLTAIDAEAKARGLGLEPPVAPQPPRPRDNDRGR